MKITITTEQLRVIGACEDGITAFRGFFSNESATREWTAATQIEMLKSPLGRYLGWAVRNKLIPAWSMQSAYLQSADLQSADLRSANLQSADLRSAYLQSADLRYANLRSADLQSADLRYADLRYADLRYANLQSAKCMYIPAESMGSLLNAGWVVVDGFVVKRSAQCVAQDVAAGMEAVKDARS